MATMNAVDVTLAQQTGTGKFAGDTSPTFVTPTLGAATATSLTFNPTTGGIVGTTTNNNATAGYVGELISSVISSGSAITFTSTVAKDLTSITLTPGDWDVFGNISYQGSTTTFGQAGFNTTSAVFPDISLRSFIAGVTTAGVICIVAPTLRYSVNTNTTVYLVGSVGGTGTLTGCGGIYARRVR